MNKDLLFDIPEIINETDWDKWLTLVEGELKSRGYRRYNERMKNQDFTYWKVFKDSDGTSLYQCGLHFYDFRKYIHRDPMANRIGVEFDCMIIGDDGRNHLVMGKELSVDVFEEISAKFFSMMEQYIKRHE